MTATTATADRAARVEGVVLVAILLIVGTLAGLASFTHVKDWTLDNSPPGTGEWFGWANAAISELIPLASLLTIRRRKRSGGSVGYPMFLLVCAVALSLAAQLAVAKPGLSGWLLSAVPALAFLGLSKLVLTTRPAPTATPAPAPAPADRPTPAPVEAVGVPASATPPVSVEHSAPVKRQDPASVEKSGTAPRPVVDVPAPTPVPLPAPVPASSARRINGVPLTREVTR